MGATPCERVCLAGPTLRAGLPKALHVVFACEGEGACAGTRRSACARVCNDTDRFTCAPPSHRKSLRPSPLALFSSCSLSSSHSLNPSTTTMNRRRALLDAADEDDLLRLQAEFQAAREVPCAAVTSVARTRDAPTVAAPPPLPLPPCPGDGADHAHAHVGRSGGDEGVATPPIPPLLGAVRERDVSVRAGGAPSLSARPPPCLPASGAGAAAAPAATSTAAFPQATHRRVSKVRVHACVSVQRNKETERERVCAARSALANLPPVT